MDLEKYTNLLNHIVTKHRALLKTNGSFSTLAGYSLTYQQEWKQLGLRLFDYILPLPDGSPISFMNFVWVGGDCIICKGKNVRSGELYSVKIALAEFNIPDTVIEKKKLFGKSQKDVAINELNWRWRFGMQTQRKAEKAFRSFEFGQIPKVIAVSTEAPVYAILQWIDGQTFAKFVLSNPSEEGNRLILRKFYEILRCYEKLHKNRIIHRDVKPENILVDQNGKIWIIDFVATKEFGDKERGDLTVTGVYMGDIRYSPPEQIEKGMSLHATSRSDVYSLAEILYFATTRRHPPRHIHEKKLRTKQQNFIPAAFRELFVAATQENMSARPSTAEFIFAYETICAAQKIYFEDQEIKELSLECEISSTEFKSLQKEIRELRKNLKLIGSILERIL